MIHHMLGGQLGSWKTSFVVHHIATRNYIGIYMGFHCFVDIVLHLMSYAIAAYLVYFLLAMLGQQAYIATSVLALISFDIALFLPTSLPSSVIYRKFLKTTQSTREKKIQERRAIKYLN
ncbi:hypothetical protein ACJX0J_012286 [Zea mays]